MWADAFRFFALSFLTRSPLVRLWAVGNEVLVQGGLTKTGTKGSVGCVEERCDRKNLRSAVTRPKLMAQSSELKKKPTRGAVYGGPSMNPHYTVGTRRSSLGISAWRNVAHRTEYESSSLFIEHWFKKR